MPEREPIVGENASADEQMERLRRLILQPEHDQLQKILRRPDDPNNQAREVGGVLPAAVRHSTGEGPELEKALAPALAGQYRPRPVPLPHHR